MAKPSKILRVLLLPPALWLALYFAASVRLFGGDRVAEVFDSSRMVSSALAGQVRSEVQSWLEPLRLIASDPAAPSGAPGEFARQLVRRGEKLDAVWLLGSAGATGKGAWQELRKDSWSTVNLEPFQDSFADLTHAAFEQGLALKIVDLEADDRFACHAGPTCAPVALVALALPGGAANQRRYAVAVVDASEIIRIFGESPALKAYLVGPGGLAALSSDPFADGAALDFASWPFFRKLASGHFREGAEQTLSDGQAPMLVSYAPVGFGGLSVVSIASQAEAVRAMRVPLWRAAFVGLALLGLAGFVGVGSARYLARGLARS